MHSVHYNKGMTFCKQSATLTFNWLVLCKETFPRSHLLVKETCGNTTCQLHYDMKTYFVETLLLIYCTTVTQSTPG